MSLGLSGTRVNRDASGRAAGCTSPAERRRCRFAAGDGAAAGAAAGDSSIETRCSSPVFSDSLLKRRAQCNVNEEGRGAGWDRRKKQWKWKDERLI